MMASLCSSLMMNTSSSISYTLASSLTWGTPVSFHKGPNQEPALLPRSECGGDDAVVAWGQLKPLAHLTQVDVLVSLANGLTPTHGLSGHLTLPGWKLVHSEPDCMLRLTLFHLLCKGDDHWTCVLVIPW